jgi:uncharacterized repeat protein (TIGR03803 family)
MCHALMSRLFTILLEHHRKSNGAGIAGWSNACAVFLLCVATSVPSSAQTFTTLANFDYANGGQPYLTSLIQGIDGNFYGTTPVGGAHGPYGTIFNITPAGTLTTFHSFDGSDGAFATAGLVQAANGTFYGTTETGGAKYFGTVFKITPDGTLTTLHSFCALTNCVDGQQPDAALIQASNGILYGTTQLGGANGHGSIFKINRRGQLSTLYSFCALPACADGAGSNTPLVQSTNGSLYGTAYSTFFRITVAGKLTTLYTFGGTDGTGIDGGLIQATDGNFYGTASAGGPNGHNDGTVFRITPRGVLTTLHNFSGADGISPETGLVQGTDGNLYGTTYLGGTHNSGTLFKISLAGELTTLYNFALELDAVTANGLPVGCFRLPTGVSTGQRGAAGPITRVPFSASRSASALS